MKTSQIIFKERGRKSGGGKGYLGSDNLAFTISKTQPQYLMQVIFDTTQVTSPGNYSNPQPEDPCHPCHPLVKNGHVPLLIETAEVAIPINTMTCQGRPSDNGRMGLGVGEDGEDGEDGDPQNTLSKRHHHAVCQSKVMVRRLTPKECGRLQGFPGWISGAGSGIHG